MRIPQRYAKSNPMPTDRPPAEPAAGAAQREKRQSPALSPAAARALAEAAVRRAERERTPSTPAKEVDGRGGPEPTRYGDWEVNGLASDF